VAAKLSGGDSQFQPAPAPAIATARGGSMPVDNIERAIKKGTGETRKRRLRGNDLRGLRTRRRRNSPGGRHRQQNRSAAEIRALFAKYHGHLAGSAGVAWMFHRKGIITITAPGISEDDVILAALDAGAEDVRSHEDVIEIITPPKQLDAVTKALEAAKIPIASAKLSYVPGNLTPSPIRKSPNKSSPSSKPSTTTTTPRPSTPTSISPRPPRQGGVSATTSCGGKGRTGEPVSRGGLLRDWKSFLKEKPRQFLFSSSVRKPSPPPPSVNSLIPSNFFHYLRPVSNYFFRNPPRPCHNKTHQQFLRFILIEFDLALEQTSLSP